MYSQSKKTYLVKFWKYIQKFKIQLQNNFYPNVQSHPIQSAELLKMQANVIIKISATTNNRSSMRSLCVVYLVKEENPENIS